MRARTVGARAGLAALCVGMVTLAAPASAQTVCPDNFVAFADTNEPLTCSCSPEAVDRGSVWGMDVYTGDSSICRAARHAGLVDKRGGPVTVQPEPGRKAYAGVTRNGVSSSNYGAFRSSFRFETAAGAPAASVATAPPESAPQQATNVCPDNFSAYADANETLTCSCSAEAADRGSVWGMDVYTGDSSICRAAVHAGIIAKRGGTVTVAPQPGRKAYAGVTRNGIGSSNYGNYASSFSFEKGGAASAMAQAAVQATGPGAAVTVCPDNFVAYADTTDPLACTCSAEAADRGAVWGMDVYTGDSSICRAARHAGAIEKKGGAVTVVPEAGRKAYPGVTRNGISSSNYGAFASSFRFAAAAAAPQPVAAPPPPPPPPVAAPVQAPIAESLRDKGEVALYVRFRTGSAELDPQTIPILDELLGAMRGQPGLNLGLIGHTDAVGTREYNRTLSYKRAEAVRFWLADRGVSLGRITVDGRGFDEPVADNAMESGRALNRRVQAKRLP